MRELKLKYADKVSAIEDLTAKGVYQEIEEQLVFGNNIHGVVEIGVITLTDATFNKKGKELTPIVLAEGYHYDVLSSDQFTTFFTNEIIVNHPKHRFAE